MGITKSKERSSKNQSTSVDFSRLAARVDSVDISGLGRTHNDYVKRSVLNCFTATNMQDLLKQVNQTKSNLDELGVFKDVVVVIDVSHGEKATPNGYHIAFHGKELTRITGSVGTEIGNNEGSVMAELAAPNLFGRGERLSIHGSYNNCKATDVNIKMWKPFYHTALGDYKPEISVSLFKSTTPFPWFKYTTHDMGCMVDFTYLLPMSITHSLQYEFAMRDITAIGKQVPFFVRENCGPRLASVLRHICAYDQRNSPILPSSGIYFKMNNEMSGIGGNISYIKNTTHAEINIPLFLGMSLQLCGRVGIMQSDKLAAPVPLSNLFTLGGPLTIRGFNMAGVGHHEDGVASGSQTFWASGMHLWSPLPFNRPFGSFSDRLRMHGFVNFGNVNSWSWDGCRCSVGAGIAIGIQRARLELNYCKPLWRQTTDSVQKEGFQFGIGYEFL